MSINRKLLKDVLASRGYSKEQSNVLLAVIGLSEDEIEKEMKTGKVSLTRKRDKALDKFKDEEKEIEKRIITKFIYKKAKLLNISKPEKDGTFEKLLNEDLTIKERHMNFNPKLNKSTDVRNDSQYKNNSNKSGFYNR